MKTTFDLNGLYGKRVSELMDDTSMIPNEPGIYFVLRDKESAPAFVEVGTGGHFKGKDPNVPVPDLEANWIDGEQILYIGKAGGKGSSATLRKRIGDYMKFGQGKNIGHYGGRYIWQLEDCSDLLVKWMPTPDEEPRDAEARMIQDFKERNGGRRPFANLKD